jgi:hypothetical protein
MFTLTPNDGASVQQTLLKDGATFDIPVDSTVKAAILSSDQTQLLAGPVTLSSATSGSNWAASQIVAVFSASDLAALTTNNRAIVMEIQVTDGTPLSWFDEGIVKLGHITG